ncbi:hypothetical protein [Campylobacter troglodytis]|uniref:hypothetical protein n=1 Tax=Campylobacter troglodytis TaxID=654363 RepID=UPI001158492B|nr:hypothetical protein [Campylobacter troglodytis]TQR53060.1 hypothetical protein DMC01_12210 [Campylobacter troglodytis]
MQKYLVSNRTDANCARFYGIITVIYLSRKLGCDFKFIWEDEICAGFEGRPMNDTIYKEFNGLKIIGAKVDSKETIFDKEFLSQHCIEAKREESKVWTMSKHPLDLRDFESFKAFMMSSDFVYFDINCGDFIFNDEDDKEIFKDFFKLVKFCPKINKLISWAKGCASRFGKFSALHLRAGDCIYGYNEFSHMLSVMWQATPLHFAMKLIEKLPKDQKLIIFSDDPSNAILMINYLNQANLISAESLRDFDKLSISELLIFDLTVMSCASEIYAATSNVSSLASLIARAEYNQNIYKIISAKKDYEGIKTLVEKYPFNLYHQSFSYAHLFLMAKGLRLKDEQKRFIERASELNKDNYRYKIYLAYVLAKYHKTKELEAYLASLNFEKFLDLLCLNYDKIGEDKFTFFPYFYLANKKYPHIQRAFDKLSEFLVAKPSLRKKLSKNKLRYSLKRLLCNCFFLKAYLIK